MQPPPLAYLSPLPPAKSGIADYSAELLPFLHDQFALTLFSDQADSFSSSPSMPIHPVSDFPAHRLTAGLPVYQMGNSALHASIYEMLLRHPGLVVLHDYALHHFVADSTEGQGQPAGYSRALAFSQGEAGQQRCWRVRLGTAAHPLHEWPLNERLLAASLGLIVHSDYVKQMVRKQGFKRPIIVSSQPMAVAEDDHTELRASLGVPADELLLASVGQITPAKQIGLALRAFARLLQTHPKATYLLVGEPNGDVDLELMIGELGLSERVKRVGFLPDLAQFEAWIKTADLVINLRHPTVGETSATALRALAAGRPVLVFDHGWYAELPETVAVKVLPMDEAALLAGLQRLANEDVRQAMGAAGQAYAARICNPRHIAQDYRTAHDAVLGEVRARYG